MTGVVNEYDGRARLVSQSPEKPEHRRHIPLQVLVGVALDAGERVDDDNPCVGADHSFQEVRLPVTIE